MTFRLNGKRFLFTYSQCPIPKEVLLANLKDQLDIEGYIISEELHQDGTPHLHAAILTSRVYNIKNPRRFDIKFEGKNYHPEIEPPRKWYAWIQYLKKDGNFIEEWKESQTQDDIFDAHDTLDNEEFLKWCLKRKIPKGYYDEVKRMKNDVFTIQEDEELPHGNPFFTNKIGYVNTPIIS